MKLQNTWVLSQGQSVIGYGKKREYLHAKLESSGNSSARNWINGSRVGRVQFRSFRTMEVSMLNRKFGVVYTPDSLADFVAALLRKFSDIKPEDVALILDPASGECSLLRAAKKMFGESNHYIGIDVDEEVTNRIGKEFTIIHNDTVLPQNVKKKTEAYWREKMHRVDAIIANPPWSSEKIYSRQDLLAAGFSLIAGQYDSYVLFVELGFKILRQGGTMAFIIPDSLFDAQNEALRCFLTKNTQIKVIARIGEKIFDEVNRATTIIVCTKELPDDNSVTECFRLSTDDRKAYLSGIGTLESFYTKHVHVVKQSRFTYNESCNFDIDTRENEEELLKKLSSECIEWEKEFIFGRGVEISKSGSVVYCPRCGMAQGFAKKHLLEGNKKCAYCDKEIPINNETTDNVIATKKTKGTVAILVGENIQRYGLQGECYIKPDIQGINYKTPKLYVPPKILIRKTGLGIYGAIDYKGTYTSQTVYILRYTDKNKIPLEYYLALINSRVVYYYYLKVYGENEWKSHPYLTKRIIFSLPIRPYTGSDTDKEIVELSKKLIKKYNQTTDLKLEEQIMKKYGLNTKDKRLISDEMNRLPDLRAINNMKMKET